MNQATPPPSAARSGPPPSERREGHRAWVAVLLFLLAATLAWSYWPTLQSLERRWSSDPQYSHGYIVPLFALIVLWSRRDSFPRGQARISWWGVLLLALGALLRVASAGLHIVILDVYTLLPTLIGLVLLIGGPAVLRWSWPALAFLAFMMPLPFHVDLMLAGPLRRVATVVSTTVIQTLGITAVSEGNVILLDDRPLGVAEACSGLGMLMTFFALSTAVAFIIQRPLRDRLIIFLSAVPVGVLMNVVRIVLTVLLYQLGSAEVAQMVFHDLAGWIMMPLALGVLYLELRLLARLFVPVEQAGPVPPPVPLHPYARAAAVPAPPTRPTLERVQHPRDTA